MQDMEHLPELPLKHHFAPGAYGREILLPAGSVVVGKIHKHGHLNIISKGDVIVLTEFGSLRLTAPYTFVSQPGTKRVVYALEETVWTTVHVTEETELDKIEDYVIAKTYADLPQVAEAEKPLPIEDQCNDMG